MTVGGVLVVGMIVGVVFSGEGRPAALLGDGIDEYLGDLYGKTASKSWSVFAHRAHERKVSPTSLFARRLGLRAFSAPKSIGDGDGGSSSQPSSSMDSLKREMQLDAAANADSLAMRRPCAGKPCFAVIDGLSSSKPNK